MPMIPVGQFLGSVEQFNLLLEQQTKNFLIGHINRREWKPDTVSVPTFKNHSAVPYQPVEALGRNIYKPNKKIIAGGQLQNLELRDFSAKFVILRRWVDTLKQMGRQANGGPSAETIIESMYTRAGISSFAVTGDALLNEVLSDDNNFVTENIMSLTTPVDTGTDVEELMQTVLLAQNISQRNAGGVDYDEEMNVGNGTASSSIKIVVPLSVMTALSSLVKQFNITIPYNGIGNRGDVRIPTPQVLAQIFKGADVITPQSIMIDDPGVQYYEDGFPKFVFEENAIFLLYENTDIMRPNSLVFHHTPLETEAEADIFEREIKFFERAEVEIKQPNTMLKIKGILSDDLYNKFAGIA